MTSLVRPEILRLKPYVSARSITSEGRVFLDANEAPDSLAEDGVNRYPEPQPPRLLRRFSELYGVPPESIVIGRGSDEAIDLLVRVFCEPGRDRILICPPTYGVYEIAAKIQGCAATQIPLIPQKQRFELDFEAMARNAEKLVFICSPNNPTGTEFAAEGIASLAKKLEGRSIVVVDEAYQELADRLGMTPRLKDHPNLVVLRTLSKAWALAGARCGVALASPEITTYLHRVRAPYPISTPQLRLIEAAIAPVREKSLQARIALLRAERARLSRALSETSAVVRVYESSANFLLVRFAHHAQVLARAKAQGIVLRDRSSEPGLEDCIRITVGSPGENDQVLELIR